jgi:peptide chain release factor subunit 1
MESHRFLFKKRLKELQSYTGSSTSMVTLFIRGNYPIPLVTSMLVDEKGASSNIKDRVNRGSVQEAIGSAIEKLRGLNKAPANGLCLFSGSVILPDGKSKKITQLIEPPREIGTFYKCDKQFHVEPLLDLLEDDRKFGFIIVDGNGALFGVLTGSAKRTVQKFEVELQGKNRAGGQSSVRFGRLRREQRYNYQRKVCETAASIFLDNGHVTVQGIIVAGSAEFKTVVAEGELLDARLRAIIIGVVDIQYGMEAGFTEAIQNAGPLLSGLKLTDEIKTLVNWMTQITVDDPKIIFGVQETLHAYDEGVMEKIIVHDQLQYKRYTITGDNPRIVYALTDPVLEKGDCLAEEVDVLEWLLEVPKRGVELCLVSDTTAQGTQFCKGFGGLGGFLQYPWKPESEHTDESNTTEMDADDFGM